MKQRRKRTILMSLMAGLLSGCVSYYYPAPVIYGDERGAGATYYEDQTHGDEPAYGETAEPAGDGYITDWPRASARVYVNTVSHYPWWSLDYFYLGHGYRHGGFSFGLSYGFPYSGFYYSPYRIGWYSPYHYDFRHYPRYAWYRPYWGHHHYWHHKYRHDYARHYGGYGRFDRHRGAYADSGHRAGQRSVNTLDPGQRQRRPDRDASRDDTPQVVNRLAWDASRNASAPTPKVKDGTDGRSRMHAGRPPSKSADDQRPVGVSRPVGPAPRPVKVISRSPGYDAGRAVSGSPQPIRNKQGPSRLQPVKSKPGPSRLQPVKPSPATQPIRLAQPIKVHRPAPPPRIHSQPASRPAPAVRTQVKPSTSPRYGAPPGMKVRAPGHDSRSASDNKRSHSSRRSTADSRPRSRDR